jgi:L-seryl-tRNA(Ser) seleniumtransferase
MAEVSKALLKKLPSVDEVLKSPEVEHWLERYPRRYVLQAVRETIEGRRKLILKGKKTDVSIPGMKADIEGAVRRLSSLSLRPLINATGIVIHTNLGRSPLSEHALENIERAAAGYSTLEYDLAEGKRGKRYAHIKRLLREVTGAEDGIAVNNNAGAVLVALSTLARGREVVVSRGELIEIGGSFRIPDVMAQSGAVLKEVGATNKTHPGDYEKAINEHTALLLKVHWSNYRITGFTSDVSIEELVSIGRKHNLPAMYDLGSGCLIDLKPLGIHTEPTVQETVKAGVDILTFSGDKLLGGPQAGIIVGKSRYIKMLQENPLLRAVRIDKLTLAALEATLMRYIDPERAKREIPTLRMLLEKPESVRRRAGKIAAKLKDMKSIEIKIVEDSAFSGGGALPEHELKTYAVAVRSKRLSASRLEERLRLGDPPVIARIKEDTLLLDARTVGDGEIKALSECVRAALGAK